MTPEHRAAKRRIKEAIATWKHLNPPGWDIHHIFIEGEMNTDDDALAETKADWQYHQATIRWSLRAASSQETKYLEGTVVHELVHVLMSGMEQLLRSDDEEKAHVNAICEHTVETVARAILRVAL